MFTSQFAAEQGEMGEKRTEHSDFQTSFPEKIRVEMKVELSSGLARGQKGGMRQVEDSDLVHR